MGWNGYVSISSSAGKVSRTEENGVISLNEHADSLGKVATVKRVARVFCDLAARLVHRPIIKSAQ